MEFKVQREDLLNELQRLQGVVEKKNTIPILSNTCLVTEKERIDLMATDLEMGIRTSAKAEITKPGGITISSRKLFEIVRLLPEEQVKFRMDENNWVEITCASSRFRMVGLPRDDFPPFPEYDFTRSVKLDLKTLRSMVGKVLFATSTDDARYPLQGTLLILNKEGLTLVATDSHRLACVTGKAALGAVDKEIRVIIPRKTVSEIVRIDWEECEEIQFGVKENRVFLRSGKVTIVSSVVEGVFPAFEKVIPKENDKVLELDTRQFGEVVRRVSLLSNERSRAVKISLQPGKVEVSSSNPEMGEAREAVEVSYRGGEVEIGFNAKYLLDFLGAVGDEKITLGLKDEQTQGMLTPGSKQTIDYRYVVMPMRI